MVDDQETPNAVAVVAGWIICGAINGVIYGGGWVLMQWDDLRDGFRAYRRAQQLGREAEEYLRGGVR